MTLSSVAFADLAIHYDSCGFRSLTWDAVAGAATYKVERKECDNCMLLSSWGFCGASCPHDLNNDGNVNGGDLGLLLSGWGNCPT